MSVQRTAHLKLNSFKKLHGQMDAPQCQASRPGPGITCEARCQQQPPLGASGRRRPGGACTRWPQVPTGPAGTGRGPSGRGGSEEPTAPGGEQVEGRGWAVAAGRECRPDTSREARRRWPEAHRLPRETPWRKAPTQMSTPRPTKRLGCGVLTAIGSVAFLGRGPKPILPRAG